jgi:hypothetical protein
MQNRVHIYISLIVYNKELRVPRQPPQARLLATSTGHVDKRAGIKAAARVLTTQRLLPVRQTALQSSPQTR